MQFNANIYAGVVALTKIDIHTMVFQGLCKKLWRKENSSTLALHINYSKICEIHI